MTGTPDLERLPAVVIAPTVRSGSDLLHSLLDGHPQVLQVPGHWNLYEFWGVLPPGTRPEEAVDRFIRRFPEKFDSVLNPRERWDELGDEAGRGFVVDAGRFRETAVRWLGTEPLTAARLARVISAAYTHVRSGDVSNAHVVLIHAHYFTELDRYARDFGDAHVLCTVRDPRNGLLAWVRTLETHAELDAATQASQVERALRDYLISVPGLRHCPNTLFVKLEDLHRHGETVMRDLATRLGIEYRSTLLQSTVNGLGWPGDRSSRQRMTGLSVTSPALRAAYVTGLSRPDARLIECLLATPMRDLGYEVPASSGAIGRVLGTALSLRTMDVERTVGHAACRTDGFEGPRLVRAARRARKRESLIRWASLFRRRPEVGTVVGTGTRVRW